MFWEVEQCFGKQVQEQIRALGSSLTKDSNPLNQFGERRGPWGNVVPMGTHPASPRSQEMWDLPRQSEHK